MYVRNSVPIVHMLHTTQSNTLTHTHTYKPMWYVCDTRIDSNRLLVMICQEFSLINHISNRANMKIEAECELNRCRIIENTNHLFQWELIASDRKCFVYSFSAFYFYSMYSNILNITCKNSAVYWYMIFAHWRSTAIGSAHKWKKHSMHSSHCSFNSVYCIVVEPCCSKLQSRSTDMVCT